MEVEEWEVIGLTIRFVVSEKAYTRRPQHASCRPSRRSATVATLNAVALPSVLHSCAWRARNLEGCSHASTQLEPTRGAAHDHSNTCEVVLVKFSFPTFLCFFREEQPDRPACAHLRGGEHDLGLVPCVPGTKSY